MKHFRSAFLLAAMAAVAGAQHIADFECQAPGAVPSLAGPVDCEGLVSNSNPAGLVSITGSRWSRKATRSASTSDARGCAPRE